MFGWLKRVFRKKSQVEVCSVEMQKDSVSHATSVSPGNEETSASASESLIEYLRLKSKKTRIKEEKFNLNNVLNDLSGSLSRDFMDSGVELIFDIDNQVSRHMVGDSLQLGKMLGSLTRSLIAKDASAQIEIKISQDILSESSQMLLISILDQSVYLTKEELNAFSVPYYDDTSGKYIRLEFYVTKEIVALMGGVLDVKSTPKEGTSIRLNVPFRKDENENLRRYRLPSKEMVGKKVFLVDSNYSSAIAIKKMLSYFRYEVDILSAEYFREKKVNLSSYDIAIFDETLLTPHVLSYLKNLKQRSDLKIVLLSSIFSSEDSDRYGALDIVDAMADKPFSQERIFEMILDLDRVAQRDKQRAEEKDLPQRQVSAANMPKVHRSLFEDRADMNPERFSVFSGNRILVVDDNQINQKILLHVLGKSGMTIDTANDGKEAVAMVSQSPQPYDLVLMDINMPVMDGYKATAILREKHSHNNLPIVALTTLILESEIEKMFTRGVNGYLSKPLEVGRLYAALEFFLEKNRNTATRMQTVVIPRREYEGLDTEKGIRYTGGNAVLYTEILREFVAAYGQSAQLMRSLVDQRDYMQMRVLCADMRNLTQAIGAYGMYGVADEMYKLLLYNDTQKVPQHIESYRRAFEKLNQAIAGYIEEGAL